MKKLLSLTLAIILTMSLFTGTTVFANTTKSESEYCKINFVSNIDVNLSNTDTYVEKGTEYINTVTIPDEYIESVSFVNPRIAILTESGIKTSFGAVSPNGASQYEISLTNVTEDLYISMIFDNFVTNSGYGKIHIIQNLTNVDTTLKDIVIDADNDTDTIKFTPKEGYKITEFYASSKILEYNIGTGELPIGADWLRSIEYKLEDDCVVKNSDGSIEFTYPKLDSLYITATAEPIETDPTVTDPTPSKPPVVKTPTISPATATLKAGTVKALKVTNGKVKSWATSNKKVATVKNGKVTALNKGKTKITATLTTGKKLTCNVTVKTAPKLNKSTVIVKRGKITSVKLSGKAKSINNKYTNTKLAKITSKANATSLKIKGVKKGTTTLKVRVNGVKTLKIKVKVK